MVRKVRKISIAEFNIETIRDGYDLLVNLAALSSEEELDRVIKNCSQDVTAYQIVAELPLPTIWDAYCADIEITDPCFPPFENNTFRQREKIALMDVLRKHIWIRHKRDIDVAAASTELREALATVQWAEIGSLDHLPDVIKDNFRTLKNGYRFIAYLTDMEMVERIFARYCEMKGNRVSSLGDLSVRHLIELSASESQNLPPLRDVLQEYPLRSLEFFEIKNLFKRLPSKDVKGKSQIIESLALGFEFRMSSLKKNKYNMSSTDAVQISDHFLARIATHWSVSDCPSLTSMVSDSSLKSSEVTPLGSSQAPSECSASSVTRPSIWNTCNAPMRRFITSSPSLSNAPNSVTFAGCRSIGLPNIGRFCYANSVLQLLNSASGITESLIQSWHQNPDEMAGDTEITGAVCRIVQIMTGQKQIRNADVVKELRQLRERFDKKYPQEGYGNNEQCAHQFYTHLCDCVQHIAPFFTIAETENVISGCKHVEGHLLSQTLENSLRVYFSEDKTDENRLSSMLEKGFAPEVYHDCEECWRDSNKTRTLTNLPIYLVIHVGRFAFNSQGGFLQKINDDVQVDQTLDLRKFTSPEYQDVTGFSLLAAINHEGPQLETGHYVSYVKSEDDSWFSFSDDAIQKVSNVTVEERLKHAYLLMYKRNDK